MGKRPYSKIVIVFAHEMCMLHKTNPVQAPFFLTNNKESNNKRIELVDGLEHANLTLHYIALFHLLSTYSLFSSVYVRI